MKLAFLLPLALSGCGLPSLLTAPPPATVANQTKLDEQAAIGIELAYQAANLAIRTANRAGALSPSDKLKAADLDNQAYRAVLAVRAAYDAGNDTNYGAASAKAQEAVLALLKLIGG